MDKIDGNELERKFVVLGTKQCWSGTLVLLSNQI